MYCEIIIIMSFYCRTNKLNRPMEHMGDPKRDPQIPGNLIYKNWNSSKVGKGGSFPWIILGESTVLQKNCNLASNNTQQSILDI